MSFDVYGKRREITWLQMTAAAITTFYTSITTRGFTGHEQIDSVGLVHMNGRVYEPELGRFMSADPVIPAIDNLQSYNRYSYVRNNPVTLTDPSGFDDGGGDGDGAGDGSVGGADFGDIPGLGVAYGARDAALGSSGTVTSGASSNTNGFSESGAQTLSASTSSIVGYGFNGDSWTEVSSDISGLTYASVSSAGLISANAEAFSPLSPTVGTRVRGAITGFLKGAKKGVKKGGKSPHTALVGAAVGGIGGAIYGAYEGEIDDAIDSVWGEVKSLFSDKAESKNDADSRVTPLVGTQTKSEDDRITTVIGRMQDLEQFDKDPTKDTWRKSGPLPLPGKERVTWGQNKEWLDARITRGDKFGIATNPSTLPDPKTGYRAGDPNGFFTARELFYLNSKGIKPTIMFSLPGN